MSFKAGFEKRANTGIGISVGALLGGLLALQKNKKVMDEFRFHADRVDAKKEFERIRAAVPDTRLVTVSELHKLVGQEKDSSKAAIYQNIRNNLELGNAAALHPDMVPFYVKRLLPEDLKNKKVIFSADKVIPSILAHEIGHIIDFDETRSLPLVKKTLRKVFRGTIGTEEAAWNKAPGNPSKHQETKDMALGTYKRARNYPVIGMIAGGLLGFGLDHMKHAEENIPKSSLMSGLFSRLFSGKMEKNKSGGIDGAPMDMSADYAFYPETQAGETAIQGRANYG